MKSLLFLKTYSHLILKVLMRATKPWKGCVRLDEKKKLERKISQLISLMSNMIGDKRAFQRG